MTEQKRGCGYRKVGGLYLVCDGAGVVCNRLPLELCVCPTCGEGVKQSRGYTWIDSVALLGICKSKKHECHGIGCVVCDPNIMVVQTENKKAGLMWVGKKFYTPETFDKEAEEQGICKRIGAIPNGFEIGKTWVLLAHPEKKFYVGNDTSGIPQYEKKPGIFRAFRPQRIEKIVTKEQIENKEEMEKLTKRGITPIQVENDEKHQGSVYDKPKNNGTLEEYI